MASQETTYFKVRGRLDGKHEVETEAGERLSLTDAELARLEKESTRLVTNDKWPNRPDEPSPAGPLAVSDGSLTQVLLEFASLREKVGTLARQVASLTDEKAALEGRVVALETAQDAKAETANVAAEKAKGAK